MAVRPDRLSVKLLLAIGWFAAVMLVALLMTVHAPDARAAGAAGAAPALGTARGTSVHMARRMQTTVNGGAPAAVGPAVKHGHGGLLGLREGTLIFTILVFLVLLAVLRATAWKPLIGALKQREDTIRESIEAAQRAKSDAQRAAQELEARIAEVQRQGAQQIAQAKADALRVAESIRNQAQQEATALKDRALRDIASAKQQALGEINSRAAELAVAVARKILEREITPQDQGRLVDQLVGQVTAANQN